MMITAHSGCDNLPANSEEYIRHACSLPVDALEVDVRRSSDGSLILTHNPPETGQEYITLTRAFDIIRDTDIVINCDLKEKYLEHDVLTAAKTSRIESERIIFTGTLTDWRQKIPNVWVNAEEISRDFSEDVIILAESYGYEVMNIDYHLWDKNIMERHNIKYSLWTIDDPREMIYSPCIINITTNYPTEIISAIKHMIR